jgi:hypothetical protein
MRWTVEQFQAYENRRALSRAEPQQVVCHEPLALDKGYQADNISEMALSKPYSDSENEKIVGYYQARAGKPIDIDELANIVDRSRWSVAMQASRLGLCDKGRPKTEATIQKMSDAQKKRFLEHPGEVFNLAVYMVGKKNGFAGKKHSNKHKKSASYRSKEWLKNNPHPRGMFNKHHTQVVKNAISNANSGIPVPKKRTIRQMKTRLSRYGTLAPPRKGTTWKSGWREIGGQKKYFRSRWEANYARYLEFQKQQHLIANWQHEPETFWFDGVARGCVSYLPDFRVTNNDGTVEFHEVKGWMDASSKTKLRRMAKYHPKIKLRVFDSRWYRENSRKLAGMIKEWE